MYSHKVVSYDDSPSPCFGLNHGGTTKEATQIFNDRDLKEFLHKAKNAGISGCLKLHLLTDSCTLDIMYDFKKEVASLKGAFRNQ